MSDEPAGPYTYHYAVEVTVQPNCGGALTIEEMKEALYEVSDMSSTIVVRRITRDLSA